MKQFIDNIISKISGKICTDFGYNQKLLKNGSIKFFRNHYMDPVFDYHKYEKLKHPYLSKWGLEYSQVESAYYELCCGKKSELYIPTAFFNNLLCPYLGRYDHFQRCWQDKNMYPRLLDINRPNKKFEFELPKFIVSNQDGIYYDDKGYQCTEEEAVNLVLKYEKNLILKSCIEYQWLEGNKILFLKSTEKNKESVLSIFKKYKANFNFQEVVCQHPDLAKYNESSTNVVHFFTYRQPDGIIVLKRAILSFGQKGAHFDSPKANGNFTALTNDGKIKNGKVLRFKKIDTKEFLDDSLPKQIPFFDKMKNVALYLHESLPYHNFVNWSLTITKEGIPYVIDFNVIPTVTMLQMADGPIWTKDELDELMPKITQYKVINKMMSNIFFKEKLGYSKTKEHLFN